MTDQELLELVMDETRAFVAHCTAALNNDHSPAGRRTLRNWHARQDEVRAATLTRLEAEAPLAVARVRKALKDDAVQYPRPTA